MDFSDQNAGIGTSLFNTQQLKGYGVSHITLRQTVSNSLNSPSVSEWSPGTQQNNNI